MSGTEQHFERELAEARRMLVVLRQSVSALSLTQSSSTSTTDRARVTEQLEALGRTIGALRERLDSVPSSRRDLSAAKLDQLEKEQRSLSMTANDQQKRSALSDTSHEHPASTTWTGQVGYEQEQQQMMQMRSGVLRARQAAEEVLALSDSVTSELREQNSLRERALEKVGSLMEQLGVSRGLLRAIARRQWVDAMFVYAGMAVISLILVAIWWYR